MSSPREEAMASEENEDLLAIFPNRYEEMLLQQRKLHSLYLEPKNDNTAQSGGTKPFANVAPIITNRAVITGMMHAAIIQASTSKRKDHDEKEIESMKIFLEKTYHDHDFDQDIHLHRASARTRRNAPQHKNRSERLGMGDLCYLDARNITESTVMPPKLSSSIPLISGIDSQDVDAFFREFPECVREPTQYWAPKECINEFDDGYSSNEDQDSEIPPPSKTRKSGNASISLSLPSNPYSTVSNSNFQNQLPSNTSANLGSSVYTPTTGIQEHQRPSLQTFHKDESKAWDAYAQKKEGTPAMITNKSNPFCTAREYKSQGNLDGDQKHYSNKSSMDNQIHHHAHNSALPYQDSSSNPSFQQNPIHSSLSSGLKKKFQTPKPRGNSSNRKDNSNKNGGQLPPPRTSHQNEEEEDELPEELKGLDKELIAKIENEIVDSGDPVTFNDIAGLKDAKQTVLELVCWPMKRPDLFTGLRKGPNGLLLFGPPGTGKTLIGKAIAHESGATFFSISSSSLTSKWIGEGEKLVRTLFAVAAYREPAVIFIDEIDSLLTQRKADENEASRRIKTEFLVQLDGTGTCGQGRVLVVGATNRPHELDDAARRRFVKRLYIPLPEKEDREILLQTLLEKNFHNITEREKSKLATETTGYSGADLKALCTDAALGPIRQLGARALEIKAEDVPPISYRHFKHALRSMNPSVAQADLDIYIKWNSTYGSKNIGAEDYDQLSDDSDEDESSST